MKKHPALEKPFTIVQLVLMDETGDSYYRMRWPGRTLAEQAPAWRVINLDARSEERRIWALEADLLVLFQSNDLDLIPIISERNAQGKFTIVEYNDNFYDPPASSPVHKAWSSPLLWQTYELLMNKGNHVIVTGEGLRRLFKKKTPREISILENQLNTVAESFESLTAKKKAHQKDEQEFRLSWAGSVGHMADLMAVLPVLEKFCLSHPHAKLCLMGNESLPKLINLPPEKFEYSPWGSMDEYYNFLEVQNIGIAPLSFSPYNLCRSDIKAVEYASRGVLPLVQNILPYKKVIENTMARAFNNFDELELLLEHYYSHRSLLLNDSYESFTLAQTERHAPQHFERLELYFDNLPETPGNFNWELAAGYHEIQGKEDSRLLSQKIAEEAESLFRSAKHEECAQFISKHTSQLEFNANLVLVRLQNQLKKGESIEADLIPALNTFPLDLRFRLLFARIKKNPIEKIGVWTNIIEHLETSGVTYQKFFKPQIIPYFLKELQECPHLLNIGRSLGEMYNSSAKLLLGLAEVASKLGEAQMSRDLYKRIREIKEIITDSKQSVENLPEEYIETLFESANFKSRM